MYPIFSSSTRLSELLAWYGDASDVIADFDSCRLIVEAMELGTDEGNCTTAQGLNAIIQHAELWLLSHPCPDPWNAQHMMAILDGFNFMGALVTDPTSSGSTARSVEFQAMAVETGLMLQEVKQVIVLLEMTAEV